MSVDIAVKKYFGDFTLDIQFQSQDNRIAVLGESGSGKSMLLKCIAGVMTPDEGHIIINDVTFLIPEKISISGPGSAGWAICSRIMPFFRI